MKDLHNHIFSNTTCISKETMLRYINKQLPKEELHQVETHMLDCELCTDAYEGMAYAENASLLFAIDNQIDQRVRIGTTKAPIIRNLMVAASVLVIVFGTYFTYNFFNETINNDNGLAIKGLDADNKSHQQNQLESVMSHSTGGVDLEAVELKNELNKSTTEKLASSPASVLAEQITTEDQVEEFEADDIIVAADEVFVAENVELEKEVVAVVTGNALLDVSSESLSESKFTSGESSITEKNAMVKAKVANRKVLKKRKKSLNAVRSTPITADVALKSGREERTNSDQRILIIDDYKVINYLKEYQEAYDKENELSPTTNSVSAGYANKLDEASAKNAKEGIVVGVTYKETLENAIRLYKYKKYSAALSEFDNILAKHPKEVNAQFYSGLCFYHLGQNRAAMNSFDKVLKNKEVEFNEEASWYKALTLIQMKSITAAKKLLKSIVQENGFYKVKADEKLKEL